MRIGSVCSGYEGLGIAVQSVMGGELAWVADIDPGASVILAHRFPSLSNLGDISAADWSAAEPVDVLTAGFPCQDVSCAGGRAGLREGNRTGVWAHVARAIDELRPSLVVLENVRGLLSAGADSDVESCPWCLGEAGNEHPLRALGAVLGDLADLGYDARWQVVSAADAGAPHRRERVFILAWPAADARGVERQRRGIAGVPGSAAAAEPGQGDQRKRPGHAAGDGRRTPEDANRAASGERWLATPGQAAGGRPRADAGGPSGVRALADASSDGRDTWRPESAGLVRRSDAAICGDAPADADSATGRRDGGGSGPLQRAAIAERPAQQPGRLHSSSGDPGTMAWGAYELAIRRWERVLGRPAPAPTEPGRTGQRLSPAFVEWLMGLPEGWVTDVPGLSRNAQLLLARMDQGREAAA